MGVDRVDATFLSSGAAAIWQMAGINVIYQGFDEWEMPCSARLMRRKCTLCGIGCCECNDEMLTFASSFCHRTKPLAITVSVPVRFL